MKSEEYKDQGLRQALQRRNEAAERMTLPEDFTDRLMEQIGKPTPALPKGGRIKSLPYWGRLVAAAACLLIIIGVGMTLLPKEELAKTEQPRPQQPAPAQREGRIKSLPLRGDWRGLHVAKSETASQRPTRTTPTSQTPPHVQNVAVSPQRTTQATDSLDYYIDKIERELAQVDESLYIERMNKVIRADERLQRIVNSYILHTLDKEGRPQTADNMYDLKTEQDEE